MKTDVGTLVILDMHGCFCARLQLSSRGQLVVFHVGPDDVVGLASGYALREFTTVVGIELPARFLLIGSPDFHLDPVDGMPAGIPNCSVDKSVRRGFLATIGAGDRRNKQRRHQQYCRDHCGPARDPEMCGRLQESSSSSSSSPASSSSSSSSISSSPTTFNSTGFTVTTSKSLPHSGQETTSPSSTSSSSMSRSLSHSGQRTIVPPRSGPFIDDRRPPKRAVGDDVLLYLESLSGSGQVSPQRGSPS